MQFTDAVVVAGTRRRDDGYLVADARVARTGIQQYAGWEVGKPAMPIVRVYRPESEVFSKDTLGSFAHRPITVDHPDELVTADNWKDYSVGQTADEIARDGQFIRVPLMVADAKAIKAIEDGKRELSAGYLCELVFDAGMTPEGDAYDAIQKGIRCNHLAIVKSGRAGPEVRIGNDANDGGKDRKSWGAKPLTDHAEKKGSPMADNLQTVVLGDKAVQVTDKDAPIIEHFKKALTDEKAALVADHTKALAAKDEEIGTLKAELQKAKDAAPKPADLDKLVADRAALVTTVKAIDAKIDVSGKSDADLRKAAVAAKLGDEMVKDASEAEIAGMFKAIAKDVKPTDTFRETVKDGIKPTGDAAANATQAWDKSVADLNAWRKEA